jgi:hypothetical protein
LSRGDGSSHVACDYSFDDPAMFACDAAGGMVVKHGHVRATVGEVEQGFVELSQPMRRADGDQGEMELTVQNLPFAIGTGRDFVGTLQPIMGENDIFSHPVAARIDSRMTISLTSSASSPIP